MSAALTHAPAEKAAMSFGPTLRLQRKCACGGAGKCDSCNKKKKGLQAKLEVGADGAGEASAQVQEVLGSPGRPLDAGSRSFFESRFGHDFSRVRVHADAGADAAARALRAHAFTSGDHMVFARGRYAPQAEPGQRLLAHELTHVVQQHAGLAADGIGAVDDPAEREAERNAERLHGDAPLSARARGHALARQAEPDGTTLVVGANACSPEQNAVIAPAVERAQQDLRTAVRLLGEFLTDPAAHPEVAAALDRHFHSTAPGLVAELRRRLTVIGSDLTGRDPFTTECHGADDTSCTNSGAYVPGDNQSMVVFCPGFFNGAGVEGLADTLIHEFAHALLGLDISDRAYEADRALPDLSTDEAMDNAESHNLLVRELVSGSPVESRAPEDEVDDCDAIQSTVNTSIARAQRLNRDAEVVVLDDNPAMIARVEPMFDRHLGSHDAATRTAAGRVYSRIVTRLHQSIDVRCDAEAGPNCSDRPAYPEAAVDNMGYGTAMGAGIGAAAGLIGGLAAGLAIGGPIGLGIGLAIGFGAALVGTLVGLGVGAATSNPDTVHLCPSWAGQATADRHNSLLSAIYQTYGGLQADAADHHAALAREIQDTIFTAPPSTSALTTESPSP